MNEESSGTYLKRPHDLPEIPPAPALLIVLSGPSATGKDAIGEVLTAWGIPVHLTVNATTRPPRPDEIDGVDYHFVDAAEFDRLEAEGALIESATVYGQRKGVLRSEVVDPLEAGRDVIARVDVQGAATLRRLHPEAVLIFVAPPSLAEARRRMESRDTEPEAERRLRLEAAAAEMDAATEFDYVLINETGQLTATARRVVEIIAAEKVRRSSSGR